ncbi:MAG TPA: sulfatase-like hydrolase/transferase, partial [Bryobacteraceae bacterium]|nr:sulfatase-like hydrolase/transferase [Bryobacteraceae bacterium]
MISRRALLASVAAPTRKPNFVFLIADDHAAYVMGADGNRKASTPHLDRLAGEGVRFARHYCNQPVCTPSRQSLLTGQMPSAAGVTVLKTSLDPNKPNLPKQFKANGYRTAVFGKMHLNRPSAPGLYGFDEMMTEQDINKAWSAVPPKRDLPAGVGRKPKWQPFKDPARIWLNAEKLPFPRYYEEMRGTFTANRAIDWLNEHKDDAEPFALWVSFPEPHSPYDFPIDLKDQHDPKTFEAPKVGPEDADQIPLIFRDLKPEEKQGIAASYYTAVAALDRNIGDVLQALDRLGLASNTCVVYLADHGYCLGQHGRFEKHCGYEPA